MTIDEGVNGHRARFTMHYSAATLTEEFIEFVGALSEALRRALRRRPAPVPVPVRSSPPGRAAAPDREIA